MIRLICILIGLMSCFSASAETIRVLMLGNSLSFFPGTQEKPELPYLLQGLFKSKNLDVKIDFVIHPGHTFEMHFNEGEFQAKLKSQKYDYVILQAYSIEALELPKCFEKLGPKGRPSFLEYGEKFVELARQNGAIPLIFEPWTYDTGHLTMQPDFECLRFPDGRTWFGDSLDAYRGMLHEGYRELSELTNAELIDIGESWWDVRKDPQAGVNISDLYVPDHIHPTFLGSYLSALVIAERLTFINASRFPYEPTEVPRAKADYLKRVAERYLKVIASKR